MNNTTKPSMSWEITIGILNNISVMAETFKAIFIAAMVPLIFVLFLWAADGFPKIIDLYYSRYFVILMIITFLITAVVILISGNKYHIRYEMDHKGVNFITLPKQQRKNKIFSRLLIILGAVHNSPGSMGIGMIAEARQNMYTDWKKVKKIIYYKKRNTIVLKCYDMTKNILFCNKGEIDEVFNIVLYYCSKAQIHIK